MRSSGELPPRNEGSRNNNNNNNSDNGNSGSQYALCALGVGIVALGIIMIVWSVADHAEVPGNEGGGGKPGGGGGGGGTSPVNRMKTSYVAFVLVAAGVVMLLLSMCLGMRNKQREQEWLQRQGRSGGVAAEEQEDVETPEERAERYAVPSYDEAVGATQYPVRQSNPHTPVQLPSYDDLVPVDGVRYETEEPDGQRPSAAAAASASNHRTAKAGRSKLLPLKIRRIKSEKMHVRNEDSSSQPISVISIEPLTPPPQYEDKVVPL